MTGQASVHRAAARLAGRELRRRPWRTALGVLLVALPVAAMVLAAGVIRTGRPPFDVKERSTFGLAEAIVHADPFGPDADLTALRERIVTLVPGARVLLVDGSFGDVQGPAGRPRSVAISDSADDPMVAAAITLRKGRLPRGSGEVALSPRLARAWQVGVGQTLELPALDLRAEVVGIANPLAGSRDERLYVGAMPDIAADQRFGSLLVAMPGDDRAVATGLRALSQALSGSDMASRIAVSITDRHLTGSTGAGGSPLAPPSRGSAVTWSTVIGALALAVSGIVIDASFTVGARRQLRTLGILASNGASPGALRAVVLWQGAWAGLLGTAAGLVLGGAALAAAWPHHDRFLTYEPRWFTVRPTDIAPIAVLGVVTALLASLQPARSVSRLSVLTSLAGRRPLAPVRPRVVLLGLTMSAAGTALLAVASVGAQASADDPEQRMGLWAGLAVLGGLGLLFGSTALAPAAVGALTPLGRRLRGSAFLALRSLGRQRARTGAVVAAVCAAASLAVAGSAATASVSQDGQRYLPDTMVVLRQQALSPQEPGPVPDLGPRTVPQPVDPERIAAVAALLPSARRIEQAPPRGSLIATPEVLDAFEIDDATRRLLRDHGAVRLVGTDTMPGGAGSFGNGQPQGPFAPPEASEEHVIKGNVPGPRSRYGFVDQMTLVTAEVVAEHPRIEPDPLVAFVAEKPLTKAERTALQDLAQTTNGQALRLASTPGPSRGPNSPWAQISFENRSEVSPLVIYAILDGIALVFTGFVIVVGLALAAAETREEGEVLHAVGASPTTLRRLAAAKAALLAVTGVALAVPTGLVPVWVVRNASSGSSRFVVPWASLGLLLVVLPAVMAGLALTGSAVLSRIRPITASTLAAD